MEEAGPISSWPDHWTYIGRIDRRRGLDGSVFHNPFVIKKGCSRDQAVQQFEDYFLKSARLKKEAMKLLKG